MKTRLIIIIALIFGVAIALHAQIPNAGFENWTSGDPDGWATSNAFPAGLVNIVETPDSHSGSKALRGAGLETLGNPADGCLAEWFGAPRPASGLT